MVKRWVPSEDLGVNLDQEGKLQYKEAHDWLLLDRRGVAILTTSQGEQAVVKSYNLCAIATVLSRWMWTSSSRW